MLFCQAVYASNEGIYSSTVFMVHLSCFTTLSERVPFIDQHDHGAARLRTLSAKAGGISYNCIERFAEKLGHLSNPSTPSSGEAQREKGDRDIFLSGHGIPDRLRELRFPGAHVTCKNHQRWSTRKVVQQEHSVFMVLLGPRLRTAAIYKNAESFCEPRFFVV